jgi:hypothetical protein
LDLCNYQKIIEKHLIIPDLGRNMTKAKARRKHHFAIIENMRAALYSVLLQ